MAETSQSLGKCENKRLNIWCNNRDVKRVRLRSQAAGVHGTNLFDGAELLMCSECRKANNGGFKIVK